MLPSHRTTAKVALGVALVGAAAGFLSGPLAADAAPADAAAAPDGTADVAPFEPRTHGFPGLDPLRHRVEDEVTVADLADGSTAVLSIDPGLQAHVQGMFARYEVPFGALVAMDPRDGRVLAYVSHSSVDPAAGDLVLDPTPPTASVFKIVTGAALFEAGVDPDAPVCFHGGSSRLRLANLEDDPARDRRCASLAEAMGGSLNSVFAKLADRNLDAPTIERFASAFGFGHDLPFDVPTRISPSEVPTERLELARTAAGFWHMHMSPLHGALIAATIANGGRMPRATLVDQVLDRAGTVSYEVEPEVLREVVPPATASAVDRMLRFSLARGGTARSAFVDPHGRPFLPGIEVAGKTGTLTGADPYRAYTWFVGYAPADAPTLVVSALVVNDPAWRIKGPFAAREAMRYWLVERPLRQARLAREAEAAQTVGG